MKDESNPGRTICIYNSEPLAKIEHFDSWCAAAIVKKKFPAAIMIGHAEGEPFPFDKIGADTVTTVGIQLQKKDMNRLAAKCVDFVFIGPANEMVSACGLAWQYYFKNVDMPEAVRLISEYHKEIPCCEALPFRHGIRLDCNSYETFPKELLDIIPGTLTSPIKNIIKDGLILVRYQRMLDEDIGGLSIVVKIVPGSKKVKNKVVDCIGVDAITDRKGNVQIFPASTARRKAALSNKSLAVPIPPKLYKLWGIK